MRFIRTKDLEKGMRLAKPVYNRNGVMLYDRDTKLTKMSINSIKKFNLLGLYILEPVEPLPPMTEGEIEFERFQTMGVFGLREELQLLIGDKEPRNLDGTVKIIMNNYGEDAEEVNFTKSLRSSEDYIYKHALNVAVLSSLMGSRLKLSERIIKDTVTAALIHDIGKLSTLEEMSGKTTLSDDDKLIIERSEEKGNVMLQKNEFISDDVKELLLYKYKLQTGRKIEFTDEAKFLAAKILETAEIYDDITGMQIGQEPSSEVVAVRYLLENIDKYGEVIVGALVSSIKILYSGVCVELNNGQSGLVIRENKKDVLRPIVLSFNDNKIYNLESQPEKVGLQIKDIMKTLDKRVKIDSNAIIQYMKEYN